MANIIAGHFDTQPQADAAVRALASQGFDRGDYTCFYTPPPGQHDLQPLGGDAKHHSEGTKEAGKTAAAGSAIGGVTGLAIGTAAAVAMEPGLTAIAAAAGAGVGAYAGALAGGLSGSRQSDSSAATRDEPAEPPAAVILAVRVNVAGEDEERAIHVLRDQGARRVERAVGNWANGGWVDFDPRRTPQYV